MALRDFDQEAKETKVIDWADIPDGTHQLFIHKFETDVTDLAREDVLKFTLLKLDPHPEGKQWKSLYLNFVVRSTTLPFIKKTLMALGYDVDSKGLSPLDKPAERMKFIDLQVEADVENNTYTDSKGQEKERKNIYIKKLIKVDNFKTLKASAIGQGRDKKETSGGSKSNDNVPF